MFSSHIAACILASREKLLMFDCTHFTHGSKLAGSRVAVGTQFAVEVKSDRPVGDDQRNDFDQPGALEMRPVM